ncbi:hypothetical protein BIFANG_02175 [Bifidobacterium angulatum DSM 20098 = JCM 7096]|uniref:Uncharacterized protein n=1 Tax=Bifidobacterium angulatum DSM 20098 = JCM 7096 TaxID=518635 RepID=C4FCZ6_9BIFI|nr:hypothetical protein BIFANG_02175 [Bifidobacterium angulatum DSM 20098 = JCM 7096]
MSLDGDAAAAIARPAAKPHYSARRTRILLKEHRLWQCFRL